MRFAKLLKKIIEIEENIEKLISYKESLLNQLGNLKTDENTANGLEEILKEEKYNNMIIDIENITKEIDRLYKLKIESIKGSYDFYQNSFKSNNGGI